jgi:hypothetical protein
MNRIVIAALAAAAATVTSWSIARWLDRRNTLGARPRTPLESWENEGGALAPGLGVVETSQVPHQ